VHLPARLGDVATGTEDDFTVVRAEPDFAGQHDRMLVLTSVPVCCGEYADLEGMLNDGHLAPVGLAGELEHRSKTREGDVFPFAGLHDRHRNLIDVGHLRCLLAGASAIIWRCCTC
jgi:hypothetical protein